MNAETRLRYHVAHLKAERQIRRSFWYKTLLKLWWLSVVVPFVLVFGFTASLVQRRETYLFAGIAFVISIYLIWNVANWLVGYLVRRQTVLNFERDESSMIRIYDQLNGLLVAAQELAGFEDQIKLVEEYSDLHDTLTEVAYPARFGQLMTNAEREKLCKRLEELENLAKSGILRESQTFQRAHNERLTLLWELVV